MLPTEFALVVYLLSLDLLVQIIAIPSSSHIPGPAINKVTKLYDTYVVFCGHRHEHTRRLHEKYGSVVRTAPNEISIIDVAAIKPVLGQLPKGPFYTIRAPNKFGSLLLLTGEAHTVRRKRWARGLNGQSLKEYQESLLNRTKQLTDQLEAKHGEAVDFASWMNFVAIDLMGDFAFGGGIEMMKDPNAQDDPFWTLCERYHRSFTTICQVPWAYNFCAKLSFLSKNMIGMVTFGVKTATERVARGTKSKDLWYHLMDEAGIEEIKPDHKDVVRDGVLAILAGTDTSAGVMCSLFYCLLSDPQCYKRAQEEVDKVALHDTQVIGTTAQAAFTYVTACINEALRMYPPLPTNGPREVPVGSGGHMVGDIMVPEGTQVYLPVYSLHRNPQYFSHPEVFKPERWLVTEPGEVMNRDAFIPFSYGYANCVGKQLAMQEMLTLTVALLQKFDVRYYEESLWRTTSLFTRAMQSPVINLAFDQHYAPYTLMPFLDHILAFVERRLVTFNYSL
ncbi:cytochrome P450 [Hymenopellis radicata]|nr:cytochrome P450 [Hymenopellis radicata]